MEGKAEGGIATILVAEDEPTMRELVAEILESGGYKVIAVADGEAAVRTYAEKMNEVSLVILDMVMPRLSGVETLRRLKAVSNKVLVLMSSGYGQGNEAQTIMAEGAAGFLGKPYQVGELLERVGAVLKGGKV